MSENLTAVDFQCFAYGAHLRYVHYRELSQNLSLGGTQASQWRRKAIDYAIARASDFKHSWVRRFGTPEPEPWA